MSKDFNGKELHIGDAVVVVEPRYHNLVQAIVRKLTLKGATVEYDSDYGGTRTVSRHSCQIIISEK